MDLQNMNDTDYKNRVAMTVDNNDKYDIYHSPVGIIRLGDNMIKFHFTYQIIIVYYRQ